MIFISEGLPLCRASTIAGPSDKGAVLLRSSLVSMWTLSHQNKPNS